MIKYEVGQIIPSFKNHAECIQFDITNNGITMLVFFNNPTENEIKQFMTEKNFEIRFVELSNVIVVTAKIGSLNWVDAPYNSNLSINLTEFILPNEGEGVVLTLMLIDSSIGKIKIIRTMSLSNNFTKELFKAAIKQRQKEFNILEYNRNINAIYSKYTTNQIVNMSDCYCRIQGTK